jgi:hypothetical protein
MAVWYSRIPSNMQNILIKLAGIKPRKNIKEKWLVKSHKVFVSSDL